MSFSFAKRADIEAVLKLIRGPNADAMAGEATVHMLNDKRLTHGWIFKTPVAGIDARSGITCGKADCTPFFINGDDELVELTNLAGDSQTVEVFNIFATAIEGEAYITAKECYGLLVADAEDCA